MNPRHADYDSAALSQKDISSQGHGLSWRNPCHNRIMKEYKNGKYKKAKKYETYQPIKNPGRTMHAEDFNALGIHKFYETALVKESSADSP